jgi:transcriptional regulator with XRE-family HTH domain
VSLLTAINFDLGARIRSIRKAKRMTIKEVAQQAGVTIGLISQIERNLANPSVKSLHKIADVLGVPIAALFANQARQSGPVVKREERRLLGSGGRGITYSLLTPDGNRSLAFVYGIYEPGAKSGEFLFLHAGEECCYIIEGQMKVTLGDEGQEYILQTGDTICFGAMTPHKIENIGESALHALWSISPPPF